jgi:uncharacterized protein YukE
MAIYLERQGVEEVIKKVNAAIEQLRSAAGDVDKAMNDLPSYWQGQAYDNARERYQADFKPMLTQKVPETVDEFKDFINTCKETIIEVDGQLAGK